MSNQNNPLVSVIIPCYNHEDFVKEAIQSVIDQDYQNIELIIIDDGSKDTSVQKIEEMREACESRFSRFEFRHRPNKGLCATLNEGLDWVQGEFLCSVASDDIWVANKVMIQVEYLTKTPTCAGVFGGVTLIDENSIPQRTILKKYKKYNFNDIFLHNHNLPTPTNMCRTHAIKQHMYDERFKIEDWYMWLKLTENGSTLDYLSVVLALYRRHSDNLSSQHAIMVEELKKITDLYKVNFLHKQAESRVFVVGADISASSSKKEAFIYLRKAYQAYPKILFDKSFAKCIIKILIK